VKGFTEVGFKPEVRTLASFQDDYGLAPLDEDDEGDENEDDEEDDVDGDEMDDEMDDEEE